ncbi:MAG: HK97 family phage prohead protease [Verrucomicrobiota bacterium]
MKKNKRYCKALFNCQMKVDGDGNGYLEGYASTFGNVDRVGDRVMPGAFAKTISQAVPAGKVSLQAKHYAYGGDLMESVGTVIDAKEDSRGLWIRAEFDADENSQAMRGKVTDRVEKGRPVGLSIGYEVLDAREVVENGKSVYELLELKLYEVTITLNPANEEAVVTAAKAINDAEKPEEFAEAMREIMAKRFPGMTAHIELRPTGAASKTTGAPADGQVATIDADADLTGLEYALESNRTWLDLESARI